MVQPGFLLVYLGSKLDRPQFLFYDDAQKCAAALGMEICRKVACTKHEGGIGPHSHTDTDNLPFGAVQTYPEEDIERAGLCFRECLVHNGEVRIVWHLWTIHGDPPAVYYIAADIVIPTIKRGEG